MLISDLLALFSSSRFQWQNIDLIKEELLDPFTYIRLPAHFLVLVIPRQSSLPSPDFKSPPSPATYKALDAALYDLE